MAKKITVIRRARGSSPSLPSSTPAVREQEGKPLTRLPKMSGVCVDAHGDTQLLSGILAKAKRGWRSPRKGDNIHVSDLISRCARKKALVERFDIQVSAQQISIMDALTYAQGDAIHDVVKQRASTGAPSRVWGRWRCSCGSLRVDEPTTLNTVNLAVQCENCESPADRYEEAEFIDPEYRIVGHPDLILLAEDRKTLYVTELKSISAKQYEELSRPLPDHVLQVVFYWFLMRRSGKQVSKFVSILYVTKGYTFRGSPYREFVIDAEAESRRLLPLLSDARDILASRTGGPLPRRVVCAGRESPEARSCEAASECFNTGSRQAQRLSIREAMRAG